jgi:hypothetical protein
MRRLFIPGVLMLAVLLGTHLRTANAQEPITPGENKLGEVTPQNPGPMYQFTSPENTPLTIIVTSNSSDFAPVVNVYDHNFELVQRASNAAQAGRVTLALPSTANSTTYVVQVLGAGGQHGQFVLSLAASAEAVSPVTTLAIGQEIDGQVSLVEPDKQYLISAQPGQDVIVQVISMLPDGGPAVILSDLDGNALGISNNVLLGSTFIIPAAVDRQYRLTVIHSGADRREDYLISVRPLRDAAPVTAVEPGEASTQAPVVIEAPSSVPTATPVLDSEGEVIIPFDGPCAITSNSALGINVRRGPGEAYDINGGVMPGQIVVVTGRDEQINWWQVEIRPGRYGWVADVGVRRGGDCSQIGVASYGPPPIGD